MIRKSLSVMIILILLSAILPSMAQEEGYRSQVDYNPQDAQYFDLVNETFHLTPDELAMLEQNGFAVTERFEYFDFPHAYLWIYWKDLPVIVTTDMMLYAVHYGINKLVEDTETQIIFPKLWEMLTQALAQLATIEHESAMPDSTYSDMETYLRVALALLQGRHRDNDPTIQTYLDYAYSAREIIEVEFLGSRFDIDFSVFKPVGHYDRTEGLKQYFRAVQWLSVTQIEIANKTHTPVVKPHAFAFARLLHQLLKETDGFTLLQQIERFIAFFFGESDNTTMADLDRLLSDLGIETPQEAFNVDDTLLRSTLDSGDYGHQLIYGAPSSAGENADLASSYGFALFGKRFVIDSYVMNEVTFDRLNTPDYNRNFPTGLDVMAALGNDAALTNLDGELQKYGENYEDVLLGLQNEIADFEPEYWQTSIHNRWLHLLRQLNTPTTGPEYPQAMQTSAWADKMLYTQLGSWAQLRYVGILYLEQTYTPPMQLCEYPVGYVEPYPAFYAALADFANHGRTLFDENAMEDSAIKDMAIGYFNNLGTVATTLKTLAEKELRLEEFTPEEELFLKSIVKRQTLDDGSCFRSNHTYISEPRSVTVPPDATGLGREIWTGWYPSLLPGYETSINNLRYGQGDYNPLTVAYVHTNLNSEEGDPPGVLHEATGYPAPMVFIVDTDEGPTIYVGATFSYYEFVAPGLTRLNDFEWQTRLRSLQAPPQPAWSRSFRLPFQNRSLQNPGNRE